MQKTEFDVAIVGAGIIGLAMAYTAAKKGQKVILFERSPRPMGATVRNFGMIWPIGQPLENLDMAMRSRETWNQLSEKAGFWAANTGAMLLAYEDDELAVLNEFYETRKNDGYDMQLINTEKTIKKSSVANPLGLKGALHSKTEINIDPKEATSQILDYLKTVMGVEIKYNTSITQIDFPWLSNGIDMWRAEQIYICSGVDFETLYPDIFSKSELIKCKLQMMRTTHQPNGWTLGPTLAAGLTLQHYGSFAHCNSLEALKNRYSNEYPEYNKFGIHVLVSQTSFGEVTIGDSHEYGDEIDPFDKNKINALILKYLNKFANFPKLDIAETWHGIYSKMPEQPAFINKPEEGVTIITGLSGAGMTLSFGLAENIINGQ
ncbi:MAG: TIGR03364 family FAD-dependent oxidoreductase [Bacteroidota bacterium]